MSDTTTIQISARLRWWQLWRRWKARRDSKALIGQIIHVIGPDGTTQSRVITNFDGTTATVADAWSKQPIPWASSYVIVAALPSQQGAEKDT